MFTEKDLRELINYTAPQPVLSVYLNTDPSQGNADAYHLRLRNLLKGLKIPIGEALIGGDLASSVSAVEKYFQQDYNWQGRSVAVFACAPMNFFKAYPLAVPVRDLARVSDRPNVKPLTDLLDIYGGYGVVLVDRQGARVFHFHLGELREQEGTVGEQVKRTKRGGSSSMPGRRGGAAGQTRAVEETVDRNIKEAVLFAVRFFEEKHVRRILIGGTDDNIALFRSELPKAWQSLVMGSFPMSMTASHLDVLTKAMTIGHQADCERERHMADGVITAAAKGGAAVIGLRPTLEALNGGRVQTLLLSENLHMPGWHCQACDHLSVDGQKCPNCNTTMDTVPDAMELAVMAVLRHKGSVELLRPYEAFEQAGGVGAALRY